MFQKDFKPAIRFMVVSDVHYKDEHCVEEERMEKAIKIAYRLCEESTTYNRLDALYVVGDFATSGSEIQMKKFKKTLDDNLNPETEYCLMMASHEYRSGGVEAAYKHFEEIFNMPVDNHRVINGFHFISMTSSSGCEYDDEKVAYAEKELKIAREDAPRKPIFFFQHPHITDTVSGSIYWADESFYAPLMNYPQVIDFSGHSHAPINDPRSIFQKYFTALGCGSLSYTELDEFDKYYGTFPPENKDHFAQMLIVEADAEGRVRVYPYDIYTDNFFPMVWEIDEPWNVDSFKYTDARYKTDIAPYFENAEITVSDITDNGFKVTFPQAKTEDYYVNDYSVVIKEADIGLTVQRKSLWSGYYFYDMPETLSVEFEGLKSGREYEISVTAGSFWNTFSQPIKTNIKTK